MPVQIQQLDDTRLVHITVSEKLTAEDYKEFVPAMERLIEEQGKLRILMEMKDFHGWEMSALWEDTKFDFRHYKDIERLAMVGDKAWQKGMAIFCKPFTTAKIRYFEASEVAEAREWLAVDLPAAGAGQQ